MTITGTAAAATAAVLAVPSSACTKGVSDAMFAIAVVLAPTTMAALFAVAGAPVDTRRAAAVMTSLRRMGSTLESQPSPGLTTSTRPTQSGYERAVPTCRTAAVTAAAARGVFR